jgi:hypothetical protein
MVQGGDEGEVFQVAVGCILAISILDITVSGEPKTKY